MERTLKSLGTFVVSNESEGMQPQYLKTSFFTKARSLTASYRPIFDYMELQK